jgi:tetratricopeptide (TPR) repeat protein
MTGTTDTDALYLAALRSLRAGRAAEAIAPLERILAAEPEHGGACLNLARALIECGHAEGALGILARAPSLPESDFLRGTALNGLGRPAQAIEALRKVLAADPGHAAALLNMGNACADLDRWQEAERFCRAAIARDPALVEAHASLGFVLTATGRLREGLAACDAAIGLEPGFAQAQWNRACALLLAGDYERGFEAYEWRKRHPRFLRDFPALPGTEWSGEAARDRIVFVRAEQGFGDTIQFARYLPLIAANGARVILACQSPLAPLLRTLPGIAAIVPRDAVPRYDLWVDQLSLPRLFKTRSDAIPAAAGYLRPDPCRSARWAEELPRGFRVGVVWAGNPAHANDRRRSLPREAVSGVLATPGIRFVSLQLGARSAEAASIAGVADFSSRLSDYAETAALIENLDLVLAVDTSVAHLAGALGKPVWVMLPYAPDWRWLTDRTDSPWYASVRLFRQPRPGDWETVTSQVTAALREADRTARMLGDDPARVGESQSAFSRAM